MPHLHATTIANCRPRGWIGLRQIASTISSSIADRQHQRRDRVRPQQMHHPLAAASKCAAGAGRQRDEYQDAAGKTVIGPAALASLADSPLRSLRQCAAHCPVGAIYERTEAGRWIASPIRKSPPSYRSLPRPRRLGEIRTRAGALFPPKSYTRSARSDSTYSTPTLR